jgi:hypothetical protein
MKSILIEKDRKDLLTRIKKIKPDTKPLWGKMNPCQMLEHCTVSVKLALNEFEPEYNEEFMRIGSIVKPRLFESEVFGKELPTTKEFLILSSGDFDGNKNNLINYIIKYSESSSEMEFNGKHPYFGVLTNEEWGMLIWKHTNHHLIQFDL